MIDFQWLNRFPIPTVVIPRLKIRVISSVILSEFIGVPVIIIPFFFDLLTGIGVTEGSIACNGVNHGGIARVGG